MGSAVFEGFETIDAATELGTVKHRFYEEALEHGREAALKAAPAKYRERLESIDLSKLPAGQPGRWVGEVTFALDVVNGTVRELGRNLGRAYIQAGLKPNEVPGTIDWLGQRPDRDAMIVVDAKSGFTRVTRAKENLQLLFAAVCSSEVYGVSEGIGAICYTRDDENPYFDACEWTSFELAAAKQRIMKLGRAVLAAKAAWDGYDLMTGEVLEEKKRPRIVVGEHCRWCPALTTCPAQGALVRRLVATPEEAEADFKRGLSDNDMADLVYRRLVAARKVIDAAMGAVYARAAQTPIKLSSGMVLGMHTTERESLDADVVAAVVRELHGEANVIKAVEAEATKASVGRLSRQLKAEMGGTMTEYTKKILEAVRARGGVRVKQSTKVQEYMPELPAGESNG